MSIETNSYNALAVASLFARMPQPPPESPKAVIMRSRIVYSFWAVILLLGIPMWWQTTSIYRASLPINQMLSPVVVPQYPINITIAAPNLSIEDAQNTLRQTQLLLDAALTTPNFKWLCTLSGNVFGVNPKEDMRLRLEPKESFAMNVSSGMAFYDPQRLDTLPGDLAAAIQSIFEEEQANVAYRLAHQGAYYDQVQAYVKTLSGEVMHKTGKNAARAFKPSPSYHLTFSLFTAGSSPSSWDIQATIEQYIQPIVHALSSAVNISIATQVQLYSNFAPSIKPQQTENGFVLQRKDLTSFINAAEWPLSPSLGTGPTINFILYVPAKHELPLSIENSEGNSWLIQQWGGIAILNPPLVANPDTGRENIISHLSEDLLAATFTTFQTHFLSLLGVPQNNLPLDLRLGAFRRLVALSLYLRANSTLGSLARLAQHLSSIPIPRHVLQLVENALEKLSEYHGKSLIEASRDAFAASEKAFFDKSMVGQVYFPDEHKVAVYLPLLGPIGVPLVIGLIKQLKQLRSRGAE